VALTGNTNGTESLKWKMQEIAFYIRAIRQKTDQDLLDAGLRWEEIISYPVPTGRPPPRTLSRDIVLNVGHVWTPPNPNPPFGMDSVLPGSVPELNDVPRSDWTWLKLVSKAVDELWTEEEYEARCWETHESIRETRLEQAIQTSYDADEHAWKWHEALNPRTVVNDGKLRNRRTDQLHLIINHNWTQDEAEAADMADEAYSQYLTRCPQLNAQTAPPEAIAAQLNGPAISKFTIINHCSWVKCFMPFPGMFVSII